MDSGSAKKKGEHYIVHQVEKENSHNHYLNKNVTLVLTDFPRFFAVDETHYNLFCFFSIFPIFFFHFHIRKPRLNPLFLWKKYQSPLSDSYLGRKHILTTHRKLEKWSVNSAQCQSYTHKVDESLTSQELSHKCVKSDAGIKAKGCPFKS